MACKGMEVPWTTTAFYGYAIYVPWLVLQAQLTQLIQCNSTVHSAQQSMILMSTSVYVDMCVCRFLEVRERKCCHWQLEFPKW